VKFYRVSHPTIMSGLVVRYREMSDRGLEISASRDGVGISGASYDMHNVDDIKAVLDRALEWHKRLQDDYPHRDLRCADVDNTPLEQEPNCVIEAHESIFAGEDKILEAR
jgi:hypothetical protein